MTNKLQRGLIVMACLTASLAAARAASPKLPTSSPGGTTQDCTARSSKWRITTETVSRT